MSSSSSKPKRAGGLQGARPQPLSLPSKKPRVGGHAGSAGAGPVIVYERTPRVVHADPHDFMAVVQRLTGKQRSPEAASGARDGRASTSTAADALVLTLGQQRRAPCRHDHPAPSASPGTASSTSPLSPSSFFLSPATMQAIRDLIS
ncbi:unnamed protein product [Triticum turgidum subsp. durum]|uniref:VQ domain-containing protein n=1 Tax=Triticum turgidum subsp. durum TaxID=4567 RepID=A0A9R0SLX1_TRITD|nr:unnamed protein product [Triticum turgidum subsp. durum]